MKFTTLLLAVLAKASHAFSPMMESKIGTKLFVLPPSDPVDKTMRGIDSDDSTFDPTGGENPALARNNKGEVWNKQVSIRHTQFVKRVPSKYQGLGNVDKNEYLFLTLLILLFIFHSRERVPDAIASLLLYEVWFANAWSLLPTSSILYLFTTKTSIHPLRLCQVVSVIP